MSFKEAADPNIIIGVSKMNIYEALKSEQHDLRLTNDSKNR